MRWEPELVGPAAGLVKEGTASLREQTASRNDHLIGVVSVPLVADVIQPADVHAVAREHPAEFRLCPVAPLAPATLLHGREE